MDGLCEECHGNAKTLVALVNHPISSIWATPTADLSRAQQITSAALPLDELKPRTTWIVEAPGNDSWVQVVGVAADTPNYGLREPVSPTVNVPYTLVANDAFDLVVKTQGDPLGVVRPIREQIHRLDGDQMVSEMTTAEQRLDSEGWSRERFLRCPLCRLCLPWIGFGDFWAL